MSIADEAVRQAWNLQLAWLRNIVDAFRKFSGMPKFVFTPETRPLIMDLADVGARIARNQAAEELLLVIAEERKRDKRVVTVEMLRNTLKLLEIPYATASADKLGIEVVWFEED